jgi:DNA helicase IV
MATHSDLEAEQRYVDRAYRLLDDARVSANRLRTMVEVGAGGTEQARYEREVIWETVANRLAKLHLGDASLVFGRIDLEPANGEESPTFYIGRLAVSDESQEPVVVDWRAPIAEPFYRATGPHPMGLVRRRHFASRGRTLLDLDDEYFGERAVALASDVPEGISGHGALVTALETARSGRLGDIVGTIQAEQDRIIRSELPGVLVVQGGPGTGKTVVALHRAAYLLYTHRFPLEGQGVLVVGPNRLFLSYIEQVLPSLGEAGVELAVLADLIDAVSVSGVDDEAVGRTKGDPRMVEVITNAVHDRRRPLRTTLRVPYGLQTLHVEVPRSAAIIKDASRRFRTHNAGRRHVERGLFEALAASSRTPITADEVADRLHSDPQVREALEWMWPLLTPAELLHDLYGSKALLRLAGRRVLRDDEAERLYRPRVASVADATWSQDDVPLLDEASTKLGPLPRAKGRLRADGSSASEVRTYGHVVVDEAQDLSPMQLRMLARRSLNGSMTIVGDIAQATGAWSHDDWHEVLDHLPDRRGHRIEELTVGYRIPGPMMTLATRVLAAVAPDLSPPKAVRTTGDPAVLVQAEAGRLAEAVVAQVRAEIDAVGQGNVAVITPSSLADELDAALDRWGIEHGHAGVGGLEHQVTVVPVRLVKGLELDATVVVEPQRIIDEERQGLRALYVAFTRATKRLSVVHTGPLPAVLAE